MSTAFQTMGPVQTGGILIVADHASNAVPNDIELGIDPRLLVEHIAWDIGVAGVAENLVEDHGFSAVLGGCSRLVVDLNRYADEPGAIPLHSDGVTVVGNALTPFAREARINRFYHPYHDYLAHRISEYRPLLILSLHSFTPCLASEPEQQRPWDIGVLYNLDDRAPRVAIPFLTQAGLQVGDQLPYSGKHLNATMNRHCEATSMPYLGIEMRQDHVGEQAGQARFAAILAQTCAEIVEKLALLPEN